MQSLSFNFKGGTKLSWRSGVEVSRQQRGNVKIMACVPESESRSSSLSRSQTYALLKQQMDVAAKYEDYKEAARLRDSLKIFEDAEPVLRLRRLVKEAIAEERFEDAARFRDELKNIAPHSLLKCSSDATTLTCCRYLDSYRLHPQTDSQATPPFLPSLDGPWDFPIVSTIALTCAERKLSFLETFFHWHYIIDTGTTALRSVGREFTWTSFHIYSKIDKAIVNADWLLQMPQGEVVIMNPVFSYHSPLSVDIGDGNISGPHPFRFFNCLADHKDFMTVMEIFWARQVRKTVLHGLWLRIKADYTRGVLSTFMKVKIAKILEDMNFYPS
ncbi:uncharacterized protein LOC107870617 isoform X1 [Capsicum annuum]|uniref:uncharacterized protein LOC107870617 isoform X1 n=1 Tax=Capsicum annuum TaxID=4072 RepID=UPI001FB14F95|nr:uncharacterized protein LOC107870617 isoform X1 [Capsicum annuum]